MKLLRVQKNILFDIIQETGLSPSSFLFNNPDAFSNFSTDIFYRESDFRFSILERHDNQDRIVIKYSPGKDFFNREEWLHGWSEIENHFRIWIKSIYNEITEIDKWERLSEELQQITVSYSNENDKFSVSEYEDLKSKMKLLKSEFKQIDLPSEQLEILEIKIDNLTQLAMTFSKFDWKSLFIGTIITIIVQLSITPENAKAIWSMIKKIFNTYFLP